mmetsp:Transcript_26010/g.41291  ORF Transcript_26010/g.41291 Transcript_26010/m.41291 type:complete len:660 (+) Transcript_26010:105-2084(+)
MATRSDSEQVIVVQDGSRSPGSETSSTSHQELLSTIAELRRELAEYKSTSDSSQSQRSGKRLDPVFEHCPWTQSSDRVSQERNQYSGWEDGADRSTWRTRYEDGDDRSTWRTNYWRSNDWWYDDSWSKRQAWNSSSLVYKEPPPFPGWNHMKTWNEEMRRWRQKTHVRLDEQAELILRGFSYEMRQLIGLTSEEIDSAEGFDLLMNRIWVISGQKAEEEMEKILLTALCSIDRASSETLSAYVERRMQDIRKVEALGVVIPSVCLGVLTKHGAKLSDATLQNFKTLSRGSLQHDEVCSALRTVDTSRGTPLIKAEMVLNKSAASQYRADRGTIYIENSVEDEVPVSTAEPSEADASDSDSEYDPKEILSLVAEADVSEDQVNHALMEIKKERNQLRKKTWPENKSLKRQIKKDRGFSARTPGQSSSRSGASRPFKKLSIDQLKLVTRCGKCGEKGHWHKECSATLFVYFGELGTCEQGIAEYLDNVVVTFLQVLPTHALLDTAAGQALIGETELKNIVDSVLTPRNLKIVKRENRKLPQSSGIGGAVRPLYAVFVPTMFGTSSGIIEFIVLPGSVPPILPAGLIRSLGADIITSQSKVLFAQLQQELPLHYYPSEHMSVEIFPSELKAPFVVSPGALKQFPELRVDSFDLLDFSRTDSK